MVRVVEGRLNVPLGGWGGQRLIQAKTEPEKFQGYLRAVKQRGLNCVRPLFHPPNAAKPNDAEWARFDWEAMDRAVALTQQEGLYFLVDYHNWLVNDTLHVHEKQWLQTWGSLAERYTDARKSRDIRFKGKGSSILGSALADERCGPTRHASC